MTSPLAVLYQLEELLFTPPYDIVIALCILFDDQASSSTENQEFSADELANVITSLFCSNSNSMGDLLKRLMHLEIKNTISEATLFRRNCMITKLLTVYARKVGLKYLQNTLKPVIGLIPGYNLEDYEIDKNRMSSLDDEKALNNVQNVIALSRHFIDSIVNSEPVFPPGLRVVCTDLHLEVKAKYPNAQFSCIGGLIFLRFICPALVSPEQFNLLPENCLDARQRRIPVLISKVLQNISNKIVSSGKEQFMQTMNSFVEESITRVFDFFSTLVEKPSSPEVEDTAAVSESVKTEALERICIYLKVHIHKLGATLIVGSSIGKKQAKEQQQSEKRGYLLKYGENIVTDAWRKRWFVLRDKQLLYFKNVQDSHAVGIIPLSDASVSQVNATEFSFEIETPYRIFRLKASTNLEASSWVDSIQLYTLNRVRKNTSLEPLKLSQSVNSSNMYKSLPDPNNSIPIPAFSNTSTSPQTSPRGESQQSSSNQWVKTTVSKTSSSISSARPRSPLLHSTTRSMGDDQEPPKQLSRLVDRPQSQQGNGAAGNRLTRGGPGNPRGSPTPNNGERPMSRRGSLRGMSDNRASVRGGLSSPPGSQSPPLQNSPSSPDSPEKGRPEVRPVSEQRGRGGPVGGLPGGPRQSMRGGPGGQIQPGQSQDRRAIPPRRGHQSQNPQLLNRTRSLERDMREQAQNEDTEKKGNVRGLFAQTVKLPKEINQQAGTGSARNQRPAGVSFKHSAPVAEAPSGTNPMGSISALQPPEYVGCLIEGCLQRRDFAGHTWTTWRFIINKHVLYQYCLDKPILEDKVLLLGTRTMECTTTSANCIELKRGDTRIILQAGNDTQKNEWLKYLAIAQTTNENHVILSEVLQVDKGGSWEFQWVELDDKELRVYEIAAQKNILSKTIQISEVVVRKMDSVESFQVVDGTESVTCKAESAEFVKTWTNEIKKAKLNYWKKQKENEVTKGTGSNSGTYSSLSLSTPSGGPTSRRDSIFVRRSNNSEIDGPPAPALSSDCVTSGYLMQSLDKEKKTWIRHWAVLTKSHFLFVYKSDTASKPIAKYHMNVGSFTFSFLPEADEFQFEVNQNEQTVTFECSDAVDARSWVSITAKSISLKLPKDITSPVPDCPAKSGYLTMSVNDQSKKYWFQLGVFKLRWFSNESDPIPVETIPIDFCNVYKLENSFIEITHPVVNVKIQAQNENDQSDWLECLLKAKNAYWRSNPAYHSHLDYFQHRGYLMKLEGKKWVRRWFILISNNLFCFKSPKEPAALAEILIEQHSIIATLRDAPFRFEIQTNDKYFTLEAASTPNLALWIDSLEKVKQQYHEPTDDEYKSPAFPDLSLRNPDKEGFLMKQGVTRRGWKRRWFVMHYPTLYYFASSQINPGEHAGTINLKKSQVVIKWQDITLSKASQFQIETQERVFFLRADTEEDVLSWVEAINRSQRLLPPPTPVIPMSSDRNSVVLSASRTGFLIKKGRTNAVWKKRWFSLSENLLTYSTSPSDPATLGVISLENCSVALADESIKKKFCFVVSTRYRNYFLQAPDQYDLAGWIESIKCHCNANSSSSSISSANVRVFNKLNSILAAHDKALENAKKL